MVTKEDIVKEMLKKQQYAFVGEHSAVKICSYTKKSIVDKDICYKQKFYGIQSHRCCQMTPCMVCNNSCIFCWRDLSAHTAIKIGKKVDKPEDIIEKCIAAQRKLLTGFGGNTKTNKKKFKEAQEIKHVAISLTGEPTIYPKLNELIKAFKKRGISTFVVSNGMLPDKIKNMELPTQLYISVDAPNEELFNKIDRPLLKDGWKRLMRTLKHISKMKTRIVLRFTIIKGMNDVEPEQWAELIKLAKPKFVEVKSYMFVGSSRQRLSLKNMMTHEEIMEFSKRISEHCDYKIIDDKKESRVALLAKEDWKDRIMKF